MENHSKEIQQFIAAAENFCLVLDSIPVYSKKEFISKLHVSLTRLYLCALELPPEIEDYPELEDLHSYESDHGDVCANVGKILGKEEDEFLLIYDPYAKEEKDKEPLTCTFWDGLSDIYADLKLFLKFKDDEKLFKAALGNVYLEFFHWGRHAAELFLPLFELDMKYNK